MLTFDEALRILAEAVRPLGTEQVALAEAHGRRLAEPVIAQVASPPANVSAMDGYALAGEGTAFEIVGQSFPGAAYEQPIGPGEAVRIFTGGALPPGSDRIIMQEQVTRDGDTLRLDAPVEAGRHVRPMSSDFAVGATLVPAGRKLDARAIVAAAGADLAEVTVWRRPTLSILATGDELAEPGTARARPGSIPESVSYGVAALAQGWGASVSSRNRVGDDLAATTSMAERALAETDVVVVTGGASVGEKDFGKAALDRLGLDLLFSKVAIKPGKPVWFGRAGDTLVLGLPGNPSSAMVTARLFLAPLLTGLGGGDPSEAARWRTLALTAPMKANGDRESFVRGRVDGEGVFPFASEDSGSQRTLVDADLLIRRAPEAVSAGAGDLVKTLPF